MRKLKIFLSSTAYDLLDIRATVIKDLQDRGHQVLHHESPTFPARLNLMSHDQCIKAVEKDCDIVLCIIDRRYGGRYSGDFKFDHQKFKVRGRNPDGERAEFPVVIRDKDLSITWCELITAYKKPIPVITFARQRTLDEKETRRANQFNPDFKPAYAEKNELFDLLDWITKRTLNNWIAPFTTVVDLREKLAAWMTQVEKSYVIGETDSTSGPETSPPGPDDTSPQPVNPSPRPIIPSAGSSAPAPRSGSPDDSSGRGARACVLVEGDMDRLVVSTLIRQLRLKTSFMVIPLYGNYRTLRSFDTLLVQYADLFDQTTILLDSDARDPAEYAAIKESVTQRITKSSNGRVRPFLAYPTIEAWLAAGLAPDLYRKHAGWVNKQTFMQWIGYPSQKKLELLLDTKFNLKGAVQLSRELGQFVEWLKEIGHGHESSDPSR